MFEWEWDIVPHGATKLNVTETVNCETKSTGVLGQKLS